MHRKKRRMAELLVHNGGENRRGGRGREREGGRGGRGREVNIYATQ